MNSEQRKLASQFNLEYDKLNPEQKMAVDSIEGPVMVIAGPGTGKTQILAIRIGKILMDTDTQPENILCLTYTDSGAVAMRKRLLKMIGPDAYRVNIHTYHSFCNQVIQDNLSAFEKSSLEAISELESIALLRELIDGFKKGNPLKRYRSDVYYEAMPLKNLFSTMKREGWTKQLIIEAIKTYIDDLPNRSEYIYQRKQNQFKAGDLKIEKIKEEKEKMEKLEAAVVEFDKYQELMRVRKRYDFDDMINWVINAFEETNSLLAKYQEQFQYILVDEYQDTSGTQNKIIELLISYWNDPNIFIVGDDDQSIFRFQGANVENMLMIKQRFPSMKIIMLTRNYRSVQDILDISKTLIDKNNERLINHINGLSKNLTTENPLLQNIKIIPSLVTYKSPREEMIGITLSIEQLINSGIEPKNIAVIYKENKYGEELSAFLKSHSISYYSKKSLNLLEISLIKKIVRLLEYLSAEMDTPFSGDEMLFEILHYDWFNIKPLEIARLSIENNELKFKKQATGFRKLISEKTNTVSANLFEPNLSAELSNTGKIIEELIGAVTNKTLQGLFEQIIQQAGIIGTIMQSNESIWQLQVLTAFFDFIKDETRKNPTMSLEELVSLLQLMNKENLSLPIVQVGGNEKGVNLLTCHGSKGLEFEHVFFAGCNSSYWEKKRAGNKGYTLPDTLFVSNKSTSDLEELRRLFYVALTRAAKHLTISYANFKEDGKELEPSLFLEEIKATYNLNNQSGEIDEKTLAEFSFVLLSSTSQPLIQKMDTDIIDKSLEKFSMNVTALNNYLKCPLEFYYKNLIRIPSPKNETLEFGSAIHYALEMFFSRMKNDPNNNFPNLEVLKEDFISYLYKHRESFTKKEFERRMEYGKEILEKYYQEKINQLSKIVSIEKNIRNVVVDGVPIKGKIDKMEFDGNNVNIVDYKTGDPEKGIEKFKNPEKQPPYGGDYWRQAVFYKLLVDNNENGKYRVVSTEFDFVEPNKKKQITSKKVLIEDEDIKEVKEQIKYAWDKIQARDFYTGCGKADCHWCNFVKTNKLAISEIEIDTEEQ
jgi:DNA helicase-2/ATP-dependent DNA helicase PcrA